MNGFNASIITAVCLYSTGHWIGGTVLLTLAALDLATDSLV